MYINDSVRAPMRTGPTNAYRIKRFLKTGDRLAVIGESDDGTYKEVRTSGGTTGWVPSMHLTGTPVASIRLDAAEKKLGAMVAENKELKEKLDNVFQKVV